MIIEWTDFEKIDMRIGTVEEVSDFPEARNPSYKLLINFGPKIGIRKSSAQITTKYSMDELVGKQVIAVVNFPVKQIGPFMSECLVLGAVDGKDVILLRPQSEIPNGTPLS